MPYQGDMLIPCRVYHIIHLQWSNPGNPARSTSWSTLWVSGPHPGDHTHITDACSKALGSTFHVLANQMAGVKASFHCYHLSPISPLKTDIALKIGRSKRKFHHPTDGHVSFQGISPFWNGMVVNRCHECIFVFTVMFAPSSFWKRNIT